MKQIKIYPMKSDYKPTEGRKYVGGVYLHGKASDITEWDLFEVSILTLEEFKEMKDGIYDVIIVTEDGTELDAIMYFWTIPGLRYGDKDLRGLVCLKDDAVAIEDAKKKFEEKVVWL